MRLTPTLARVTDRKWVSGSAGWTGSLHIVTLWMKPLRMSSSSSICHTLPAVAPKPSCHLYLSPVKCSSTNTTFKDQFLKTYLIHFILLLFTREIREADFHDVPSSFTSTLNIYIYILFFTLLELSEPQKRKLLLLFVCCSRRDERRHS